MQFCPQFHIFMAWLVRISPRTYWTKQVSGMEAKNKHVKHLKYIKKLQISLGHIEDKQTVPCFLSSTYVAFCSSAVVYYQIRQLMLMLANTWTTYHATLYTLTISQSLKISLIKLHIYIWFWVIIKVIKPTPNDYYQSLNTRQPITFILDQTY